MKQKLQETDFAEVFFKFTPKVKTEEVKAEVKIPENQDKVLEEDEVEAIIIINLNLKMLGKFRICMGNFKIFWFSTKDFTNS